ncbi:uncharacterized protein FOMMEDRAFT_74257 [Fomitiporia mediterranea MF3/22]|uniref:uncharacterized protein n=1 Tax=Fomitiporia mediterranea (strain MF3/22) TaxID=694068 RepID=UPI0004409C3B|nr:uncharacterized protein FOMMEDRAFT_74257 [Fomitiporia mediterranea MF3/22]EJD07923.1 hypothetical protein FOMMEDRAFT_74257 [Fomitiporia mediterranea MF3/22]
MDPNELIVFWFDIALLCVIALFFLLALPRIVARFSRPSEWARGQLLYGGSAARNRSASPPLTTPVRVRRQNTDATFRDYRTDDSHTLAVHDYSMEKGRKGDRIYTGRGSPPPHVPAFSTLLYPALSFFSYSVAPGKSVGKLTLALLFIAAVIALQFIKDGNPLTESVRLGWFATALIPITIVFATKNNVIGMLLGMGYEKLNFAHRWIGIVSFITANLHAIGFIYKWAIEGILAEEFEKDFVIHGTIALAGIEILFFASLGWVRNKAYTFFLFSHVVGYSLFLIALCFHREVCIKWVVLGACIYALDHLLRLLKTRFCVARIKTVPELGLVRLEIPAITRGWRAGQHVRVRILSTEIGLLACTVAHPFTVANAPGGESAEKRGLTLLVKKAGNWTSRLYDIAGRAGYYPTEDGYGTIRNIRVIVEGPYGGLGHMMIASFSSVMLVGGGSGVTFVLSQAEELVQAVQAGKSSLRFIEIVWITQDQASIGPLLPTFSALIDGVTNLQGILLKISIFYSRAPSSSSRLPSSTAAYLSSLAPTLSVHSGRPALDRILDGLVRLTAALGRDRAKGVTLGVCGPQGLVEDVKAVSRSVDGEAWRKCGGVEVHEE